MQSDVLYWDLRDMNQIWYAIYTLLRFVVNLLWYVIFNILRSACHQSYLLCEVHFILQSMSWIFYAIYTLYCDQCVMILLWFAIYSLYAICDINLLWYAIYTWFAICVSWIYFDMQFALYIAFYLASIYFHMRSTIYIAMTQLWCVIYTLYCKLRVSYLICDLLFILRSTCHELNLI